MPCSAPPCHALPSPNKSTAVGCSPAQPSPAPPCPPLACPDLPIPVYMVHTYILCREIVEGRLSIYFLLIFMHSSFDYIYGDQTMYMQYMVGDMLFGVSGILLFLLIFIIVCRISPYLYPPQVPLPYRHPGPPERPQPPRLGAVPGRVPPVVSRGGRPGQGSPPPSWPRHVSSRPCQGGGLEEGLQHACARRVTCSTPPAARSTHVVMAPCPAVRPTKIIV